MCENQVTKAESKVEEFLEFSSRSSSGIPSDTGQGLPSLKDCGRCSLTDKQQRVSTDVVRS